MPGDKYIFNSSGTLTEKASVQSSAGAGNAGNIPALDSSGRLDSTMMPSGIGVDSKQLVASEALSAGNFVNIYNNAGTPNCRKADATTSGKKAHGFVSSAVSNGGTATVFLRGINSGVTGMTAGPVFLNTTAGGATGTAPSGSGNFVQEIGVALSATEINFAFNSGFALA